MHREGICREWIARERLTRSSDWGGKYPSPLLDANYVVATSWAGTEYYYVKLL